MYEHGEIKGSKRDRYIYIDLQPIIWSDRILTLTVLVATIDAQWEGMGM